MNRLVVALVLSLAIALPAAAQDALISDTGQQAMARFRDDDLAGAIALLEPLRREGRATDADLALLGTFYQENGDSRQALDVLRPLAEAEGVDAAVLYNAGRAAKSIDDVPLAAEYFARSVDLIQDSPAARELGLIRGAQRRFEEAFALLDAWTRKHSDDVVATTAAAVCALHLDRSEDAERLIATLPDTPQALLLRGQLLIQQGDPIGALEILEPMLDRHPREIGNDLRLACAEAYLATSQSKKAIPVLREIPRPGPRVLHTLAEALFRAGEIDEALVTLAPLADRALESGASQVPIVQRLLLDYSRILIASGREADAIVYLEKATEIDPKKKLPWRYLGDTLIAVGRQEEGEAALERMERASPSRSDAEGETDTPPGSQGGNALAKAQQAISEGKSERALQLVRQEIERSPDDIRPRFIEARVLLSLGRVDEALASAERTLQAFPDHPDAIYQRGAVQLGMNRQRSAEQDLRRTLEIAPDHVGAMSDLSVLLAAEGEILEARRLLERLLELRPDDASLRQRLDELQ